MKKVFILCATVLYYSAHVFSQNVGIGTNSPASKTTINGNLSVGSGYTGTAAPSNGVIIEGKVGVGTNSPDGSTILDITAGNKGVSFPNVNLQSASDVTTIPNPKKGLVVYNTGVNLSPAGLYINTGSSGTPNWQKLSDASGTLSGLSVSSPITTTGGTNPTIGLGVVPVANGGTGLTAIGAGNIPIGTGATSYINAPISSGTGINVVSASGSITVNNTGVISNVAGTGISVSGGTGNVTITNTGDLSNTNEAQTLAGAGTTDLNLTQAGGAGGGIVTFTGTGATTVSRSGNTFTINSTNSGGTVTSVTGTAPIVSSGGATPAISINAATGSNAGSMSASDKAKLDAATNANTGSTLVMRDASGNFSAGQVSANLLGLLVRTDIRTIAPSSISAGAMQFGFTSWANNNSAPYADFLHLRSYTDASGGFDNLVMFRKDAIGMRIYQQTWGSATPYSSYKDVAFTSDLNSAVSGTVNYLSKFTGANTLGNSLVTDDGTTVTSTGQTDISGGTGTVYNTAPLEIKTTSTPRIGFHWPGVVASQIGMDNSGLIRTYDNPGTGYERFAASNITANGILTSTGAGVIGTTLNVGGTQYMNTSSGQGSGAHGISWYTPSYLTWFDYMAPPGTTNSPSGTVAPSDAAAGVNNWARRFNIENAGGYGWLFESGANAAGSAPTVKFAINSNNGNFHATGNGYVDGTISAGASAIMGTGIAGGYYQDATNGAYRSIVSSGTTNGYYFQTNAGATTTMYVGLGGTYNGRVGIGTSTPGYPLEIVAGGANTTSILAPGYIQGQYFNSNDNSVGSGVTGIMVKQGDNYLRTATAAAVSAFLGGTTTGSGTTNTIPKWTSSTALGNSLITDDGSTVTSAGQTDITGGTGTVYTTAPIEIRTTLNPRLSFHWPGVVASQIGMASDGTIRTYDNPGTGYEKFAASSITANGNIMANGTVTSTNYMYINHSSPSLILQDNDERNAAIHCNSNRLYFLSGSGTNGTGWTINGSYWPLYFDLNNDAAIFGGAATFAEGAVTVSNLAGTGNRRVFADANGVLNASGTNIISIFNYATGTSGSGTIKTVIANPGATMTVAVGDVVILDVEVTLRLTGGSGVDDFSIRPTKNGTCTLSCTDATTTPRYMLYRPDEGGSDHDNYRPIHYMEICKVTAAGTLGFGLDVYNSGDDTWEHSQAVLVARRE